MRRSSARSSVRSSSSIKKPRPRSTDGVTTTPTLVPRGMKRSKSNLATPAAKSINKPPFKIGYAKINDKKWIDEQYMKVRRFLKNNTNCSENNIPDRIKPITLETFVYVMNILLKEINPKIEVTTKNYVSKVSTTLTALDYPVHTIHAWQEVITIFGWLVDFISNVRRINMSVDTADEDPKSPKAECVIDYIFKRYLLYNSKTDNETEARKTLDKEFAEGFARILNIDEKETERLRNEVNELRVSNEKQLKEISEQNEKNHNLKTKIDALQNQIDTYYESKGLKLEELNCEIESLKGRREKLMERIKSKKESINALEEAIKNQPYNVEDKRRILKRIEELKHLIAVKKDLIKHRKALEEEQEEKLEQTKNKITTEVYRLDYDFTKLTLLEPDFTSDELVIKILHLKEVDCTSEEFAKDIQMIAKNIKMFENKFQNVVTQEKESLIKTKKQISTLEMQVESTKEQLQTIKKSQNSLTAQIEALNKTIENLNKKREEQKIEFAQKMKALDESAPNVEEVRQRLKEITELKIKRESEFKHTMEKSVEFFETLRDIIMKNLVDMNEIRTEVFTFLQECLEKVNVAQNGIAEDLHHLDELLE